MEDNKKIEFEMSKLILATYNKIALWNNNDYDTDKQKGDALKIVSHDIVQTALEELLIGMNVKTNTEVFRGDTKVGDIQTVTDEDSFEKTNDRDIFNELFKK
jgi:hypothetical protein